MSLDMKCGCGSLALTSNLGERVAQKETTKAERGPPEKNVLEWPTEVGVALALHTWTLASQSLRIPER